MNTNKLKNLKTNFISWVKFNISVPQDLRVKGTLKNNKSLLFFSIIIFLFGLALLIFTFFRRGFSKKATIEFVYYAFYMLMGLILFPWCLATRKNPTKLTKNFIQPIHAGVLIFLLDIFFAFITSPNINVYTILVCVTVIIPTLFFVEPVIYNPMVTILLFSIMPTIYKNYGLSTVFNDLLFIFVINAFSLRRWKSLVNDYNHEQKQSEYIQTIDKELALASNVQKNFFKHEQTKFSDWILATYNKPMAGVSGDFFDIYNQGENLQGLGIFDVSGHGISSGLVTMLVKNIIYTEFYKGLNDNLKIVLERINQNVIKEKGDVENYLTGILIRLEGNNVNLVSAGHALPILYKAKEENIAFIKPSDQVAYGAIGMRNVPVNYAEYNFTMEKGDESILYTDGITDAKNEEDQTYGKDKFLKSANRNIARPLSTQVECIISDIKNFTQNRKQNDDITLLILERK